MATQTSTGLPNSYASASLYVGDLNSDVTEAKLYDMFNVVGPVASVRVCRDAATRRSLGYAYVNFHRVDDAERALDTLNFQKVNGRPCRVMWSNRDPQLRKSGAGNVFINNLALSIDSKELYDTFSMFGNILSCKVATAAGDNPVSLGYGFVQYQTVESAQSAIEKVNGKMIMGAKVTVELFKPKKDRGDTSKKFTNVYVKNLPADYTDEKLKTLFGAFGEITSSIIRSESAPVPTPDGEAESKEIRKFGFVNFATPEAAMAAIEALNEKDMGSDIKLYVSRHQKKAERSKQLNDKYQQQKAERMRQFAGVNLYVKNLADDMDDDALREAFKKFGSINSTRVMRDEAGKSKGFGFVCFSTSEESTKAVTEMNSRMLNNKPLYVAIAQRKEDRRAQLVAQYNQRHKMQQGVGQTPMYQHPSGMYPNMQPRMMPYQQMSMGWGQPPQMAMMGGNQNYRLVPAGVNGNQRAAPNGPRRNNQGNNRRQQQPNQKFNKQQGYPQQQAAAPVVEQQQPTGDNQHDLIKALAEADKDQRRQMIGERLFPRVCEKEGEAKAGKITGMLLEMDDTELLHLLESDDALNDKIQEALTVLAGNVEEETTTSA